MSQEIVITFETIYDLLRKEKASEELQQLDPSFHEHILKYLKQKQELLHKKQTEDDLFALGEKERLEDELKNIRRVLKELYDRRERKTINMAINKSKTQTNLIDTSNLLHEERQHYEELVLLLNKFRQGVLGKLLKGEMPEIKQQEKIKIEIKKRKIRFLSNIQEFIAEDLATYGPYEKGTVIDIPEKVAKVLVENKNAELF